MERAEISSIIERIHNVGMPSRGQNLNDLQKVVYAIIALDTLVCMEGMMGFYIVEGGDVARQAVHAFETIGALKSAALIRTANSFFPTGLRQLTVMKWIPL